MLLAPALIYTLIFGYLTYTYMIIAFEKYNYQNGLLIPFAGLKNFETFFKSTWAWQVTRNTVWMNMLFIITGVITSVALALLLNEVAHKRFLKVAQSTMLFPFFISWAVVAMMLYTLLSTETGLINRIIENL